MTPPVPAEAVARLTKYLDAVDESHRSPFQKSVSYTDHDAGTFAWEVFKVSDLRALLAAYADAARDRERMREVMNTAARSLNDLADTDGAYLGGWGGLMNTLSHRLSDAARTGEAR